MDQEVLVNDPRFFTSPCAGQHGWVSMKVGGRLDWKEIESLLVGSYRLVALKRMIAGLDSCE